MEKKLPIKYPPITSYPQYAYLLSFITTFEGGYRWFLNNYIQLFTNLNNKFPPGIHFVDRFLYNIYNPFTKYVDSIYDYLYFFKKEKLQSKLIEFIDNSIYCQVYFDQAYLPDRFLKPIMNHGHQLFIYGYTDKGFLCADFVDEGRYTFFEVTFDNFNKGINSTEFNKEHSCRHNLILFKIRNFNYTFDLNVLRRLLQEYYHCKSNIFRTFPDHVEFEEYEIYRKYGLDVYDYFFDYLKVNKEKRYDLRPIFLLKDHKRAMCMRVEFLIKEKLISNSNLVKDMFQKVLNDTSTCLNINMKLKMLRKQQIFDKMLRLLEKVQDEDRYAIEALLNSLK